MTVLESLLGISAYPIPLRTIEAVALKRAVCLDDEATTEAVNGKDYRLAMADLFVWLYFAPNVGQGGQSYSFTDSQRDWWKRQAMGIYDEYDDEGLSALKSTYGYMGSKL